MDYLTEIENKVNLIKKINEKKIVKVETTYSEDKLKDINEHNEKLGEISKQKPWSKLSKDTKINALIVYSKNLKPSDPDPLIILLKNGLRDLKLDVEYSQEDMKIIKVNNLDLENMTLTEKSKKQKMVKKD